MSDLVFFCISWDKLWCKYAKLVGLAKMWQKSVVTMRTEIKQCVVESLSRIVIEYKKSFKGKSSWYIGIG